MTRLFGAVLAVGMLCTPLMAQDYKIGDLQIRHPYVSVAGKAAIAAAGYFQIVNHGDQPDRLVEVTTVAAMAMIHQSAVDTDGVASMAAMPDGVSIPAGETVTLEPGGLHVMFTGLASPFVDGTTLRATLVFERAGRLDVDFNVEKLRSTHDHGAMPEVAPLKN